MLCQGGSQSNREHDGNDNDANNKQDRSNDTANLARLGQATSSRVHGAGIYLFEITGPEDPGHNGKWTTNNQAEDAEDKN